MAEKKSRSDASKRGRKGSEANADPEARLAELREELFRLRFQFATRQLTNTSRIRQVRREVARVKTLRRQYDLAVAATDQA